VSLAEFRAMLDSGRKLKIKFGADVTAGFLHIGHAVNLWMMREMQERGHLVQFLIGDFTTRVGDPTGRSAGRVPPSREDMERFAAAFVKQVGRVLITDDAEVFEVRRNSEWWDRLGFDGFLSIAGSLTTGRLLSRDMFRARVEAGSEIRLDEMLYPILQGWDSVELGSDLTIVGSDQLFNESMGRFFQAKRGMRSQVIVTTRITMGLGGKAKQSKSLGNFVAIDDAPREMFGKVMSLSDDLLRDWFEVYTDVDPVRIDELCGTASRPTLPTERQPGEADPRAAKLELAKAIVARWWGDEAAQVEADWFRSTFSQRGFPQDAPALEVEAGIWRAIDLAALLAPNSSRGELRRLIEQGGFSLDGERVREPGRTIEFRGGTERHARLGKRSFFRVRARSAASQ
jgi:tyrosyl-tRNA synthetase